MAKLKKKSLKDKWSNKEVAKRLVKAGVVVIPLNK